jgi:hypothetical protein
MAEQHFDTPHYRPQDVGQDPHERKESHGLIRWVWQAAWTEAAVIILGIIFLAIILWFAFVH